MKFIFLFILLFILISFSTRPLLCAWPEHSLFLVDVMPIFFFTIVIFFVAILEPFFFTWQLCSSALFLFYHDQIIQLQLFNLILLLFVLRLIDLWLEFLQLIFLKRQTISLNWPLLLASVWNKVLAWP